MWCIRKATPRRAAVAAALLAATALSGCGFRPLHRAPDVSSAGDASAATLASIRITPIANRAGQELRNMLLARMTPRGAPDVPRYVLTVALSETRREIALRSDETPTRVTLTLTASFALSPVGQARVFHGGAISANGYNVLQSEFATLSAERDARRRGLAVLAEDITLRVASALQNPVMFRVPTARAAP